MYTILLRENKALTVTQREAIIQYSNLVDKIQFLIPPTIGENDMTIFDAVLLEYLSPVTKIYRTEFLVRSEETYKNYLQYFLPVDTKITAEAGDLELTLTFYKLGMTPNGDVQRPIFKTQSCKIKIIPISNWSNFIPDYALTALDDKITKLLALQNEITEIQGQVMNIIDDENVSDKTTYSSKKIEEKFLDDSEVDKVDEEDIEKLFDGLIPGQTPPPSSGTISKDDIEDLFGDDADPDEGSGDNSDNNDNNTDSDIITEDDINNLFN